MDKIVSMVSSVPSTKTKDDDDFCDRMSSRYTVVILVVFALLVSATQYAGTPIKCWAPVHFTDSHTKFANSYCWVKNTYYVPWSEPVPREDEDDKRQVVPYYQWIPFILLSQAIFFYLPSIFWHGLNQRSGVDADNILESANSFMSTQKVAGRDRILQLITNQMDRFLWARKMGPIPCDINHIPNLICRPFGRRFRGYLVMIFLISKILYAANVIAQFFILDGILGTRYSVYGAEMLTNMVADHDWTEATHVSFPRVTLCDFKIRRLGNVHRYTVQCVLPINLINEKIYIFLWFWMVIVAFFTVIGFLIWLTRSLFRGDRKKFIKNHLIQRQKIDPADIRDDEILNHFLDDYLRQDGAFLLRLIGHNTNNITVTEITCSLFEAYQEHGNQKQNNDDFNAEMNIDDVDNAKELDEKGTLA